MWRNVHSPAAFLSTPRIDAGSWLSDATVYLAEGCHAVAEITVMTNTQRAFPSQVWRTPAGALWPDMTPVHLRYRWWADDPADFFGYVVSSRVLSGEQDARYASVTLTPVQYTLVGASMTMQSHRNRLWRDSSPSAMARTIAQENSLLPWVQVSGTHFDQRMQAQSDWSYLAELADRIGYRLFLDGSTLHFVDRSTVLAAPDRSVPQFWQRKLPGAVDSLREFSGVIGDTDPDGGLRSRQVTTALNRQSVHIATSVYTTPRTTRLGVPVGAALTQQYSDLPARSYAQGQSLLTGDAPFLWVNAQAVVNGDSRLKPGTLVDLRGEGIGEAHQGLWMVRSATHRIVVNQFYAQRTQYAATLRLGRTEADRLVLPRQSLAAAASYGTRLVHGRWRAVSVGGV